MHKITRGKHISLEYLAGFFDGEGSIFITKINNKRSGNIWYRMCASCGNSNKEIIEELHNRFSPKRKNFLYRPSRKSSYKPCYQWLATGNVALNFLKIIEPEIIVKRNQVRLGIEFQNWRNSLPNTGKRRTDKIMKKCEEFYLKMRKLNLGYSQPQRLSEKTHPIK